MTKRFTSGNYFQVSNYIFQFELKPSSFVLYCYLKMRDNPERGCFPTKETIAKDTGLSMTTVENALRELKRRGLVFVEHRYQGGHQTSNLYKLRDVYQQWLDQYFIPEAIEEELEREEESENFVREVVEDDLFGWADGSWITNFFSSVLAQKILCSRIFLRSQIEEVVPTRELFSSVSLRNLVGTQKLSRFWSQKNATDFEGGIKPLSGCSLPGAVTSHGNAVRKGREYIKILGWLARFIRRS